MGTTQETFLGYAQDLIEELSELARRNDCPALHYILKIAAAEASSRKHQSSGQVFAGPYLEAVG